MAVPRRLAIILSFAVLFLLALSFSQSRAAQNTACPGTLPTRLAANTDAQVTPGKANNVRQTPSKTGRKVGEIPGGAQFHITEGPVCADGFLWWKISYHEIVGWTPEGDSTSYWLEPLAPGTVSTASAPSATGNTTLPPLLIYTFANHQYTFSKFSIGTGKTDPLFTVPETGAAAFVVSPDARHLLYMVADTSTPGKVSIFTVNTDGTDQHRLVENARAPIWSPDGGQIAYMQISGGPALAIMSSDGSNQHVIVARAAIRDQVINADNVVWSADQKTLIFTASAIQTDAQTFSQSPRETSVWIVNADGGGLREIFQIADPQIPLFFSPKRFFAIYATATQGTYLFNVGEPDRTQKISDLTAIYVQWSPNGKYVGFYLVDDINPGYGLGIFDADGTNDRLVTKAGDNTRLHQWGWSPDSARVVFETDLGLFTSNVDGSERKLLASQNFLSLLWAPNGSYLIARTVNGLVTINVETSTVSQVISVPVGVIGWLP